jgi:transcriptional regulator with XRE-family HTH domain
MKSNSSFPKWPQQDPLVGVEHFGQRLQAVMGKESMASFARECNISEAMIRKYLKTSTLPGIENALAISTYTGKSLSWLITGVEETNVSATPSSLSERLTDEEIAKWWGCIFDALTVDDKTSIIRVFKLGGLNALFKSDIITSTLSKLNSR